MLFFSACGGLCSADEVVAEIVVRRSTSRPSMAPAQPLDGPLATLLGTSTSVRAHSDKALPVERATAPLLPVGRATAEETRDDLSVNSAAPVSPSKARGKRLLTLELRKDTDVEGGSALGIVVQQVGADLVLSSMSFGLVENYNKSVEADRRVYPGDIIVSVSGESGGAEKMTSKLEEAADTYLLEIRCVPMIEVTLRRDAPEVNFGISLVVGKSKQALMVKGVKDTGVAAEHNKANADACVKAGMRILAVNDLRVNIQGMCEEAKNSPTLHLLLREGVPMPTPQATPTRR
mmetsp:Transcript_16758/g.43266  ORF Transcript_16758/g.43266 Transcript_16758/m.43266 type:complete len:291 (-) Transcript_16758:135-1007(-)